MPFIREFVIVAVVSYLLGSIPFGYLLVRIFRGEDVRLGGSGNIGATNVARKSPVLGVITLLLDALKGSFAVWLTCRIMEIAFIGHIEVNLYPFACAAGLFAVVGHMFPIWLKFHGGKGVATALGSFLLIAPKAVLVAAIVFIVVVLISRRVSLGSIVAAALFPSTVYLLNISNDPTVLALIGVAALLIIARHYQNILRLLSGTEPRFSLGPK
jgi:acyl phosphate:glycerol-3-phosphate acyltransferase